MRTGYAYGLAAGLGNTEYSITAYPGVCLQDKYCWGNLRGMLYQWFQTSDTGGRATEVWGDKPEKWNFSKQPAADLVIINLGTNDANPANFPDSSRCFLISQISLGGQIHTCLGCVNQVAAYS